MSFSTIAWWAYLLTIIAGIGFGLLQSWLLKRTYQDDKPRRWIIALKLPLWLAAMVAMALISVPLLLVFVVAATIVLFVISALLYRKAQREAR